jgi:ABC-type dipeptide/oligopeptide/nickel transport system permease component
MKTYVAQRLGIAVLTLIGMSIVIFVLLRLAPGDIVDILFSTAGYVNDSEKQAIMKELGLDRPYWVQYVEWMGQIFVGDLGKSYRTTSRRGTSSVRSCRSRSSSPSCRSSCRSSSACRPA